MASESSSLSQSSLSNKDEFEGVEVTEFDANALWELLYEEEAESGGGAPLQPVEVAIGSNPDLVVESNGCLDVQYFDWLCTMEEFTYTACNDMGGWYGGPCMEEILEMGDVVTHTAAVMSDEIGYIGLWQHN